MRRIANLTIVGALLGLPSDALAQPARFWLSTSAVDPNISAPPALEAVTGSQRYLHIWGQPGVSEAATDPPAPASSTLQSLSLNLLAMDHAVEFLFDATTVYNPLLDAQANQSRYQFIGTGFDANDEVLDGCLANGNSFADGICSLVGFSLGPVIDPSLPQAAGIGPACDPNDPFCRLLSNGEPAWLIASVAVRADPSVGSTELHLQVGPDGMNHQGHRSSDTQVVFDRFASSPMYQGGLDIHRSATLPGDLADAVINVIDPAQAQLLTFAGQDGDWTEVFGPTPPSWNHDVVIGSEFVGRVITVTGSQQANSTTVDGGRLHLSPNASLASDVSVGASGMVSGTGWLGADLTLSGMLETDLEAPLNVVGAAHLQDSMFRLPADYSQEPGTISEPVTILTAGRVDGAFALGLDYDFGDGVLLHSIEQTSKSVVIQLRVDQPPGLPGDFDDNNRVDGADFLLWQRGLSSDPRSPADLDAWEANFGAGATVNQPGDFNADTRVDGADFLAWQRGDSPMNQSATDLTDWQQNFGLGVAVARLASNIVPEPTTVLLTMFGAAALFLLLGRNLVGRKNSCDAGRRAVASWLRFDNHHHEIS